MSNVAMLKAMARNYDGRKQLWDRLDIEACIKAANEIEQLQAKIAELEEENARLKEIEQTNDTLLDQLGDKNAALIDEVASQKHCYAEAVAHYEKQLAASQAELAAEQLNNKRLRDALEFLNARIVT